jgi:rod shape determining protein RodA
MIKNKNISQGVDYPMIWLYSILVAIGILCIFMVEYRDGGNWFTSFIGGKTNYSKQLFFAGFCVLVATFILLTDSKLFTAFANLIYSQRNSVKYLPHWHWPSFYLGKKLISVS